MGEGDWRDTDTDCPECGCSDTVEHKNTGAIWCKSCGMEYVGK
jgi:ribosomal protein L37AE/L43A